MHIKKQRYEKFAKFVSYNRMQVAAGVHILRGIISYYSYCRVGVDLALFISYHPRADLRHSIRACKVTDNLLWVLLIAMWQILSCLGWCGWCSGLVPRIEFMLTWWTTWIIFFCLFINGYWDDLSRWQRSNTQLCLKMKHMDVLGIHWEKSNHLILCRISICSLWIYLISKS